MTKVRCADCGYLAARFKESRQLGEVEQGMRKKWDWRNEPQNRFPLYEQLPICFADENDFAKLGTNYSDANVTDEIKAERECGSFMAWRHGRTPREHEDMTLSQEARDRDLKWQEERRADDRQWQEDRRADDRKREDGKKKDDRQWQEALNRKNRSHAFWNLIIGALIALAGTTILKVVFG